MLPQWLSRRLLPRFEMEIPPFKIIHEIVIKQLAQYANGSDSKYVLELLSDYASKYKIKLSTNNIVRLVHFACNLKKRLDCKWPDVIKIAFERVYGAHKE